jgi:hypothetical protein
MSETYRFELRNATVRPEQHDALADLVRTLFNRRNQGYVGGQERMWLQAELVQTVRRASTVYREALSTPISGPAPFAIGYLRIQDGQVETISDTVPATLEPKALARLLSEFLAPGATIVFPEHDRSWTVEGVDDIVPASLAS